MGSPNCPPSQNDLPQPSTPTHQPTTEKRLPVHGELPRPAVLRLAGPAAVRRLLLRRTPGGEPACRERAQLLPGTVAALLGGVRGPGPGHAAAGGRRKARREAAGGAAEAVRGRWRVCFKWVFLVSPVTRRPTETYVCMHVHRYDACVGKCADTHIGLVKGMEEKLAAECKKRLK